MPPSSFRRRFAFVIAAASLSFLLTSAPALAHCDTMDGPVVIDARTALDSGDITPVLKWVRAEDEHEIRAAFDKVLTVRKGGGAARELADTWFFETVVRVHRAGEGAPYTGLKPAGSPVDPAVRLADRALETGSAETLVKAITSHMAEGLDKRFAKAHELRKHAADSAAAGRAYVAAYVEFVHYAEEVHQAIAGRASGHQGHIH
jgi:hypothetical protein